MGITLRMLPQALAGQGSAALDVAEIEEWGCGEPAAEVSGESRLAEEPTV